MNKKELALALSHCYFLTTTEKMLLLDKLDNLDSLTVFSLDDISFLIGRAIKKRNWDPLAIKELVFKDLKSMKDFNISFITYDSPNYPPLLREIYNPPFSLFWRGFLPDPNIPLVSIVGTRQPSGEGAKTAYDLGNDFAKNGVTVVSGLANGVDAFAHRGNYDAGGQSIAVLACGLEHIYPSSNKILAKKIIEGKGCILSEYAPKEAALTYRFPERNRIIAGLGRSVIVVEAPKKSGALITANFALEQGKDVFVSKQAYHSARAEGIRNLHNEGAIVISSANDVLTSWGISVKEVKKTTEKCIASSKNIANVGLQLALEFKKNIIER